MKLKPDDYRIKPGRKVDLKDIPTDVDGGLDKDKAREQLKDIRREMQQMQEMLYAQGRHALLVVFQAMDAGGKDSTIRRVIGPLNPQGVTVTSFKVPTEEERQHDFLWRIHRRTPGRGRIAVFNRSHYEDVLVVRVKKLVPSAVWRRRYEQINAFEQLLASEGVHIVKFYLHISKDYQKRRLQRRLDRPEKHWKFNPADLAERARWHEYREAFEEAIGRCSTEKAPWYVVPSECRWYRDLVVARTLLNTMRKMELRYPEATFDASKITIE